MLHARKDYQERIIDTAGLIPDREPVMIFRGQDKHAHHVIQIYADIIEKDPGVPNEMVQAIRAHAHKMWLWSNEHGKTPDCPAPLLVRVGE